MQSVFCGINTDKTEIQIQIEMAFVEHKSILLMFILIFHVSAKCDLDEIDSSKSEENMKTRNSSTELLFDVDEIMAKCNESFRTSIDYLREFNATGSLPDESDKTPMCYIRCYFEKLGIIEEGMVNKTKLKQMWWPATSNAVDLCQKEGETESNPCMASYAIVRCLMQRALIDAKNNGAK